MFSKTFNYDIILLKLNEVFMITMTPKDAIYYGLTSDVPLAIDGALGSVNFAFFQKKDENEPFYGLRGRLEANPKLKDALASRLYESLFNFVAISDRSVFTHERAYNRLQHLNEFAKWLLNTAHQKDLYVLDLNHIFHGDPKGGVHIRENAEDAAFEPKYTNPNTGVSYGKVRVFNGTEMIQKGSTTFPKEVKTKEDFLTLMVNSEPVDLISNRGRHLYFISKEKFNELFNAEITEDLYTQAYVSDRQWDVRRGATAFPCLKVFKVDSDNEILQFSKNSINWNHFFWFFNKPLYKFNDVCLIDISFPFRVPGIFMEVSKPIADLFSKTAKRIKENVRTEITTPYIQRLKERIRMKNQPIEEMQGAVTQASC